MRRRKLSLISALLVSVMLISALAACGGKTTEQTTEKPSEHATEKVTEKPTEKATEETTEKATEETTEKASEDTTEAPVDEGLEGKYADTILAANALVNGVQDYYDGLTNYYGNNGYDYYVHNQEIDMLLLRDKETKDQYVGYIKNKNGGVYIENTFDVYLRTEDGRVYYTLSKSTIENLLLDLHNKFLG